MSTEAQVEDNAVLCPRCKGAGESFAHINRGNKPHTWENIACFCCNGLKLISKEKLGWIEEGKRLKKYKDERDMTTRDFAIAYCLRISEVSEYLAGEAKMPNYLRELIKDVA